MKAELEKINSSLRGQIIFFKTKNSMTNDKIKFIRENYPDSNELSFLDEIDSKINEFNIRLNNIESTEFAKEFKMVNDNINRRLSFTKIKEKHSDQSLEDLSKLNKFSDDLNIISDNIDYNSIDSLYSKKSQIVSDMSLFGDIVNSNKNLSSNSSEEESSEDSFM